MDNTIENAILFLTERGKKAATVYGAQNILSVMLVDYAAQTYTDKNRHIAELENDAVLSADAIGLLQHDNARLEKENTDLRRALSECKAKARIGISPENR